MKIIQSFWSKPFLTKKQQESNADRTIGGYNNEEQFWTAMALSCLTLSEFYEVELITDSFGKEILTNKLNLPYKKVSTELDSLQDYDASLWALGKIKAFSLQREPFLHVDNDVFIWEPFPSHFEKRDLIAQSEENNKSGVYTDICNFIESESFIVPEILKPYLKEYKTKETCAYNAGIIGGCNIDFFQLFSRYAFQLVDLNIGKLNKIDTGLFNMFFEQSLFYSLSLNQNIPVFTLFPNSGGEYIPVEFDLIPKRWYIHTIGITKRYDTVCEQVHLRLLQKNPALLNKIKSLEEFSELQQ